AVFGTPPEPGQTLPGIPDEEITTHLDVEPWAERKLAAMRAHDSEVRRGGSLSMLLSLPEEIRALGLNNEWYRRLSYGGPRESALSAG
ncbi:hypothetical protein ACFQ08_09685, partial [Streptosporangium algeriense]